MSVRLAPSILSADFAHLARDIAAAEAGGADLLHVDVMDGHFVPNLTIGPPVIRAVRRVAAVPLDVHLMVSNPEPYLAAYVEAGAAWLTVHAEAVPHLHRAIHAIRDLGAHAGVALNPSTPVAALEDVAADLDFILVMSVNPGFGGQHFIPRALDKVRQARALVDRAGRGGFVEVDGGLDTTNIGAVVGAGASTIVAGQAVFGHGDPAAAVRALRAAAGDGRHGG